MCASQQQRTDRKLPVRNPLPSCKPSRDMPLDKVLVLLRGAWAGFEALSTLEEGEAVEAMTCWISCLVKMPKEMLLRSTCSSAS